MAGRPLRALVLEDAEDDARLLARELGRQGFDLTWERAWTAPALRSSLETRLWDVVLSDYSMEGFDAPAALRVLQETGLDLPFIVISGTIGEDAAVAAMRSGAHDYLMKGNLKRLGAAIERELRDAGIRREHRLAIEKIQHLNHVLRAIRNVNQLIVTEKDRGRLLQRASEILVETRGYSSALCVLIDDREQPGIVAYSAVAGQSPLAPDSVIRTAGLTACMKEALRSAGPVIVDGDTPVCADCPLHLAHLNRHRLARAIEHDGRSFGALSIALPAGIGPDAEEIDLIDELAGDLGFALQGLENSEQLLAETAMTAAAINAMQDTFFLFDPTTGRALRWNEAFRNASGYTDEEIAALPAPQSYYDPDDLQRAAAALETMARGGAAAITLDLVTRTGARVPTEYSATSIRGRKAGEVLVISVGRDITERKQLQAQLAQSDRLASMGMLAAGVAHEINNPLTYVLYNLESLTEDLPRLSSALRRLLGRAVEQLGHDRWAELAGPDREALNPSLLEDILARFRDALEGTLRIKAVARGLGTFSRVEQDRLVPVNLMHVIEVAVNMVFNEIKYRARLVKEYGAIPSIMASDGRLSQVFLNLLVNAAHAIAEGDAEGNEIRVRTWEEGGEVCAEVRDTGRGIAAEHLPRLFEPFFSTKAVGVGTGLGLSISKSIVEGYGGRIEVSSAVGRGTSFVVRLPVGRLEAPEEPARPARVGARPEVHGRVLVVDDEAALRAAMVRMLSGHDTVQAASGEEARKILEADQAFDLILCDMMMPAMSGVDLHEWLTTTHPDLADQVVFVTGGAFTPRAREYLNRVSNIRLEKPFYAANFKKIVSELIVAYRTRGT